MNRMIEIFHSAIERESKKLAEIRQEHFVTVVDGIDEQLEELFRVHHPPLAHSNDPSRMKRALAAFLHARKPARGWDHYGAWAWYPWKRSLVHVLPSDEHQELRTARNRNLITKEEQEKFRRARIGVAGLSVGNSAALTIVLQGGGEIMRIADADTLALSNLNRIRSSIDAVGLPKTEVAARQIYDINPYARLALFENGITKKNIKKFLCGPPKLDILVEEMDNLEMKIEARRWARKLRIPVVMAADDGDGILLDVERFDREPNRPLLHGRIPERLPKKNMTRQEMGVFIGKYFVGEENVPARMRSSLMEIGKTLYTWPQLGGAATLAGVVVASVVRRIVIGESIRSGRCVLSLDDLLDHDMK